MARFVWFTVWWIESTVSYCSEGFRNFGTFFDSTISLLSRVDSLSDLILQLIFVSHPINLLLQTLERSTKPS